MPSNIFAKDAQGNYQDLDNRYMYSMYNWMPRIFTGIDFDSIYTTRYLYLNGDSKYETLNAYTTYSGDIVVGVHSEWSWGTGNCDNYPCMAAYPGQSTAFFNLSVRTTSISKVQNPNDWGVYRTLHVQPIIGGLHSGGDQFVNWWLGATYTAYGSTSSAVSYNLGQYIVINFAMEDKGATSGGIRVTFTAGNSKTAATVKYTAFQYNGSYIGVI